MLVSAGKEAQVHGGALFHNGIIVGGAYPAPRWLSFLDAVLRGMGQIMLQNNSYAGLIFLIGIACNSALIALAALVGTVVSTATALMLGANPHCCETVFSASTALWPPLQSFIPCNLMR